MKQQKENSVNLGIIKLVANTTLWWLHRLAKQKVSFVFCSTKDLQKINIHVTPGKLSFFAYVISRKWSANQQNNHATMPFMPKQACPPKSSSILQKIKIGPKCYSVCMPFLQESLQLIANLLFSFFSLCKLMLINQMLLSQWELRRIKTFRLSYMHVHLYHCWWIKAVDWNSWWGVGRLYLSW